jgi:hypothetical protein
MLENIRQTSFEQEQTSVITVSKHDIAQWLLTAMTTVGSGPNQLCIMFSTSICLVNHDISK